MKNFQPIFFSYVLIFNKKQNGLIFQIDTGEGKSCVIQIIAAVLSLMNENVHIVSSNIKLSNRDYEESLNFFRIIGKETSVLLHKNERDFVGCYKNQKNEIKNKFPEKFFDDYCFENSLNMNINVCDKNKGAKIVFSTLANFQYYYLWLMSKYPGSANSYFNESFLLMDEADSTLIDELANGAILSHSIKTNAEEVLTFIYKNRNQSPNLVLEKIKEDFPNCKNMTIEDINNIYDEIDTVNSDEFSKGYKYRLEELEFEENDDLHNLYDKYRYDSISDEIKNNIKEMVLNFLTNNIKNKNKPIKFTHVVPFDSANKGISEPNKEFTGFIQQLIAIKEKIKDPKKNANLITANLAMNYIYVSQPFFINLYHNGVCGFTGTIGDEYDIKLYNDSYSLKAKKIPRENENYRVDLPKIICEKEEKKVKIYEEIKLYHKRNYPVLVIFQNSEELDEFKNYLVSKGMTAFNVFDGKKESDRPEETAGIHGAISLGTNVCGRGVDILIRSYPLHVIIAYYSANSRIIGQAIGRTARQGKNGTTRIICSKDEFLATKILFDQSEINLLLNSFNVKKDLQVHFIDHFNKTRSCIFADEIGKPIISNDYVCQMRNAKINVNRFKDCNFVFPVCMDVETFLDIQVQKIFSLYNLPNCDNTWMIFQRYIREMIFFSLSLTIDQADREYKNKKMNVDYQQFLSNKINELIEKLKEYLPENDPNKMNIISTYMHLYSIVVKKYSKRVFNVIPDYLSKMNNHTNNNRFVSLSIGFKPYSVTEDSGEKVDTIDGSDQSYHSIQDPELKFYQQKPNQNKIVLSITKKVDQLFEEMCNNINEKIENTIGMKFFLRRTLAGCEFGICYDFGIINLVERIRKSNDFIDKDPFFLVDKDPLLLFSIHVRSSTNAPLLAGILVFCLFYIVNISKKIFDCITNPSKAAFKSIKSLVLHIIQLAKEKIEEKIDDKVDDFKDKVKEIINEKISSLLDPVYNYLIEVIEKQINIIDNEEYKKIFNTIFCILTHDNFSIFYEKINELFNNKTIIKIKQFNLTTDLIPIDKFLKIGVLLILCISSFMMNFYARKQKIKFDEEKVAKKFNQNQNVNEALKENIFILDNNVIHSSEIHFTVDDLKNDWLSLDIVVIHAKNIPKMDVTHWCDPYVVITNSSYMEVGRTNIIENTKLPVWNYKINLKININDFQKEVLTFTMYDYDKYSRDDYISEIKIPVKSMLINNISDKWYEMIPGVRARGGGQLRISFYLTKL